MIDAIIAVFAIIILASAAIIGTVMVGLIVFGLRVRRDPRVPRLPRRKRKRLSRLPV